MKIEATSCFILSVLLAAGCASPETKINRIAKSVAVSEQKHDIESINNSAASILNSDLASVRLYRYSDETINTLYKTLRKIALYSPDNEDYVLRQEIVFNEKIRRGKYNEDDVERMVSALLLARMFDKAGDLKRRFPNMALPDIPNEIVAGNIPQSTLWQVYEVSDNGKKAELKSLSLSSGPQIVIVMSPGCGVMESAAKAIFEDAEINQAFRTNGTMITRGSDFTGVGLLKKRFKFTAIYVVRKSGDFPGFWLQSSPRFYFLRDGKILYELRGWSDDNEGEHSKGQLRKGLLAIGIKTKPE